MTAQTTSISTAQVSPGDRVEFWEEWNSSSLVGLRCSTLLADGLRVSAKQRALGDVTITEISGEQHSVERSPQALRSRPGDSIFVSILTRGSAFFTSPEGMIIAHAGESILYSTDQPYLFGFDRTMSQLILTVPMDVAYGDWGLEAVASPRLLAPDQSQRLSTAASAVIDDVHSDERALHEMMLALEGGSATLSALHVRALAEIRRRLGDDHLTPAELAATLAVSERQLRRAFESSGQSPAAAIQAERLDAAHRALQADAHTAVAEVAARYGFASPAHFSRVFRARFGSPPSALRG